MHDPQESCANCRFREHVKAQATAQNLKPPEGDECHRNAPQSIVIVQSQGMQVVSMPASTWPAVLPGQWCGHWTPERPDLTTS